MIKLTAQQIFDKLLDEEKILSANGQIRFFLGDVDIIVK
ncbi:NgoBV family restriction endonuclease [Neisseria gonorrhoeae]